MLILVVFQNRTTAQSFTENFDNLATLTDWFVTNNSDSPNFNWFTGANPPFAAQAGNDTSYVACNYQSSSSTLATATLSNWLFTPNRTFSNGDVITFYSRTVTPGTTVYPDRLEVRLSTNGASMNVGTTPTSVGDYTTVLLTINPSLTTTGYPAVWTLYTATISGLATPTSGRVAFRYFVTNGGPAGANSFYIGVDTYSYTSNSSISDAAVNNVYTLGTIATPLGNPHQVKANIKNTGTTTLTNKVVTLNVTGANTFTNTQTIASLAPGASTVVTFAGYTSSLTGTNNVTVTVPTDGNNTNNSISVSQTVNTNSYNYGYGATIDNGLGFTGATGDLAAKFSTNSANSISQVKTYFYTGGQQYLLKIWDATGAGGSPGTVLYTSSTLTSVTGVNTVNVAPAVAVNGAFYVGVEQVGTAALVETGVQYETPVRVGTFYYATPIGGTWTEFSTVAANYRMMIEPIFSCSLPAASSAITGTTAVCQGSSQTYTANAVSGATSYTWTLPGGWTGTSTSNSITVNAGATGGNISVVANNGCGAGPAQTLALTVTSAPATPGAILGSNSVCPSTSNTYSIAAVAGATTYNWTLPSGWSGSSTSNSISATAGANGGSISVTATNACGTSAAATLSISISSGPAQPGTITGSNNVCANSTQAYSIAAVSGATSYTWTLPSGWNGASNTTSVNAIAGTNSGVITVVAVSACGTSIAQTFNVTVNSTPTQPTAISGNAVMCNGISAIYSVAPVSGASSYNWSLPAGWSGASNSNSITATAGVSGGTISVTATNSCGTSIAQTVSVSVSVSAPSQPSAINGSINVCSSNTNTYTVNNDANASSYNWTLPGGWSGNSTTNSISATAGTSGGTIIVTATNGCGTSAAQSVSVIVNISPAQPGAISGQATVCSTSNQLYSVSPVGGATSYTWTLPGGFTGTSTTNSINTVAGSASGVISVTANNSICSSPSQTFTVTVNTAPATPSAITGVLSACLGASQQYSVVVDPTVTAYSWTLPSGWSGSSSTNSITSTVGNSSGTISVIATNACGTSSAQTLPVTVNFPPPQPGSITGSTTVCSTMNQTYSIGNVSGATSYTWTLPNGWSGASSTTYISAFTGASGGSSSGILLVTANNGTCASAPQTLVITINDTPTQPSAITGTLIICDGSTQTYSVASVAGVTAYNWVLPNGWTGSSTTNSITLTASSTGGVLAVSASNACGTSALQSTTITVNSLPATPTITVSGNVLASSSATGNQWNFNGGTLAGETGQFITVTIAGFYTLTVTNTNGCSATSAPFQYTSIDENQLTEMLIIYPNPSNNLVNIMLKGNTPVDAVFISDVLGKVVKSIAAKQLNNNSIYTFDSTELTKGMYFVTINVAGKSTSKKLVIN